MIITRLMGGMGNTMFQYAFGLACARRLGTAVALDPSMLTAPNRGFALGQWSMQLNLAKPRVATVIENGMRYNRLLAYGVKDNDVLQGYWQSEKYFIDIADELRRGAFVPIKSFDHVLLDQIRQTNSVAVHVRRGDYLIEPHKSFHGNLNRENYYKPAMDRMRGFLQDPHFFIFTDDPEWVKENWYTDFSLGRWVVVEPGRESEDIYLMSKCKHAIIANSSFSWWGAWLGDYPGRTVIAPQKWFSDEAGEDYSDIVPDRWIKI